MNQTIRHGLPLLAAGQAQKEVTHNEALLLLDRRLHLVVETRQLTAPPIDVAPGSAFIVPPGASGAWAGTVDQIASHDGFGWDLSVPSRGTLAWIADEQGFTVFDGQWSTGGWPTRALRIDGRSVLGAPPVAISAASGGVIVDAECRRAITAILASLQAQGIIL